MHVGRVAGQQHPAHPELLRHQQIHAVLRNPPQVRQHHISPARALFEQFLHRGKRQRRRLLTWRHRHHKLKVLAARQVPQREPLGLVTVTRQQVTAPAVEPGHPDVAHDDAFLGQRTAEKVDAGHLAHRAATAVGAHEIGGADRAATGLYGHTLVVLRETCYRGIEFDDPTEFGEPCRQDLVGPPLRDQPREGIRHGRLGREFRQAQQLVDRFGPDHLRAAVQPHGRTSRRPPVPHR